MSPCPHCASTVSGRWVGRGAGAGANPWRCRCSPRKRLPCPPCGGQSPATATVTLPASARLCTRALSGRRTNVHRMRSRPLLSARARGVLWRDPEHTPPVALLRRGRGGACEPEPPPHACLLTPGAGLRVPAAGLRSKQSARCFQSQQSQRSPPSSSPGPRHRTRG